MRIANEPLLVRRANREVGGHALSSAPCLFGANLAEVPHQAAEIQKSYLCLRLAGPPRN
jgi:hypothetical protein